MAFDPSTATLIDEPSDEKKQFDPGSAQPIEEPAASSINPVWGRAGLSDYKQVARNLFDLPAQAAVAAGTAITGTPYWPTQEEVEKPIVSPETVRGIQQWLGTVSKPAFDALGVNPQSTTTKIVSGAGEGMADAITGLTSPANLALLPLGAGKTAVKLLGGVFAAKAAADAPDQWKAFNETDDPAQKSKIAVETLASLGLPLAAFLHGEVKGAEVPKVEQSSPLPEIQDLRQPMPTDQPSSAVPLEPSRIPQVNENAFARFQPDATVPRQMPESVLSQSQITPPLVEPSTPKTEGIKEADVNAETPTGQNAPFVPSAEWQEVPDGTILPNGGEYRFDQKSGKNFARWKPENLPVSDTELPIDAVAESQRSESPSGSRQTVSESNQSSSQPENTPSTTGVANRVLEEEAPSKVGIAHEYGEERFPEQIDRGEGTTVEAQVARGRDLLQKGVDPGQIVRRVERTGRISGDDMSVLRAQLETFQHAADTAAEAARTNPGDPVLKRAAEQAMQNELSWRKTIKPAATAFHEIGMTLQGQAEVNYGTFEGLRRSAFDLHGKDVTPEQALTLREASNRVRRENQFATESLQRATAQIDRTMGRKAAPRSVDQLRTDLANRLRKLTPC
jgi:hypothetical protein